MDEHSIAYKRNIISTQVTLYCNYTVHKTTDMLHREVSNTQKYCTLKETIRDDACSVLIKRILCLLGTYSTIDSCVIA